MSTTISSQRYLDDEILAEKIASHDFVVRVSPEFNFDGANYRVVLDGHHSLAAARAVGVDPEFIESDATDDDNIALLDCGKFDDFLQITKIDSDYYDINTGRDIW